jgi:hypothetical protein
MKKTILLLAILLTGTLVNAQVASKAMSGKTYIKINTDYTVTDAVETWLSVEGALDFKSTQDFRVELDSTSGDHSNVAVALYGKKFSGDDWTQIGSTVNWAGTTSDTTITISNTTANRYRFFKFGYTGTGTGVTTVDKQEFKLWKE